MYRKGQYDQLLQRLQSLRMQDTEAKSNIADIQEEVNQIIEDLRDRGESENARIHFFLLSLPMLLVIVWHMIQYGSYFQGALFLLLGSGMSVIIRLHMSKVIRASHAKSSAITQVMGDPVQFVKAKIEYIFSAIDIKKARLLLMAVAYIIFFPLFLVMLHEVVLGSTPFDHTLMAYFVAFAIAGILWFIYFDRAFGSYDQIEEELTRLRDQL